MKTNMASHICVYFFAASTPRRHVWSQTPKDVVEIKTFVNLTNYKTETIVIEKVPEGSGSAGQTLG